jgi:xanthine/CO dehydrogenase XdhC/CoxF family maturation factor
MALATVVDTQGSTYSKAGALMLIDELGVFQGMLSGGCLEGDLAIRAQVVIESGEAQLLTYDLGSDNDELWGLGVGCDGLMRVLLQPVVSSNSYEPFAAILAALDGIVPAVVSTVVESSSSTAPVASCLVLVNDKISAFGVGNDLAAKIDIGAAKTLAEGATTTQRFSVDDGEVLILHSLIMPAPRILILGGGLDAEPLVRYGSELGWKCTIVDHRPAYIDNGEFAGAEQAICSAVDDLPSIVDLGSFDAAIVMSHHLASDRGYLEHLAETEIAYVGVLGPIGRRERLMSDLGAAAERLSGRLHGPAGLDIGGRGPAAIALSIAAQLQKVLARD